MPTSNVNMSSCGSGYHNKRGTEYDKKNDPLRHAKTLTRDVRTM